MRRGLLALLLAAASAAGGVAAAAQAASAERPAASAPSRPLVVGSKRFTESYILGEIVRQTLQAQGIAAEHRPGLGNTGILEQALATASVDVYPEYTGTIVRELLKREGNPSLAELNAWLAPRGLKAAVPLGFNNSYAIAMRETQAEQLGIRRLSDLRKPAAAALRWGLSHEFLARADGWPALRVAYALAFSPPSGIDHGIAYDAIAQSRVDVIDVYSTDAKLGRLGLRVLEDDRGFFPKYDAVLLMRAQVDPTPLRRLEGRIDTATMIALNGQAELDGVPFEQVARRFLAAAPRAGASAPAGSDAARSAASAPPTAPHGLWSRLTAPDVGRLTLQHLLLVFGSVVIAVAVGVPLGIAAWRWPATSAAVLGAVGVLQTVPSIALLAMLIALVGHIGLLPAVIALFLYALLPIVRNTHTGLGGVSAGLRDAALSLGLTRRQALLHVQLPLARPVILAGIKTAAVINVGTATVAAFIGAGGFGERIVAGLAINDTDTMLAGALPAAALALLMQAGFGVVERVFARRSP